GSHALRGIGAPPAPPIPLPPVPAPPDPVGPPPPPHADERAAIAPSTPSQASCRIRFTLGPVWSVRARVAGAWLFDRSPLRKGHSPEDDLFPADLDLVTDGLPVFVAHLALAHHDALDEGLLGDVVDRIAERLLRLDVLLEDATVVQVLRLFAEGLGVRVL